jgi:hypothetical protein
MIDVGVCDGPDLDCIVMSVNVKHDENPYMLRRENMLAAAGSPFIRHSGSLPQVGRGMPGSRLQAL